jgi:hypothetical protein
VLGREPDGEEVCPKGSSPFCRGDGIGESDPRYGVDAICDGIGDDRFGAVADGFERLNEEVLACAALGKLPLCFRFRLLTSSSSSSELSSLGFLLLGSFSV